jgi:hypothetical protein
MDEIAGELDLRGCNDGLWEVDPTREKLFFPHSLWPFMRGKGETFAVSYYEAALSSTADPSRTEGVIPLPSGRRIVVSRRPACATLEIKGDEVEAILKGDANGVPHEIRTFERIPSGLGEYF